MLSKCNTKLIKLSTPARIIPVKPIKLRLTGFCVNNTNTISEIDKLKDTIEDLEDINCALEHEVIILETKLNDKIRLMNIMAENSVAELDRLQEVINKYKSLGEVDDIETKSNYKNRLMDIMAENSAVELDRLQQVVNKYKSLGEVDDIESKLSAYASLDSGYEMLMKKVNITDYNDIKTTKLIRAVILAVLIVLGVKYPIIFIMIAIHNYAKRLNVSNDIIGNIFILIVVIRSIAYIM